MRMPMLTVALLSMACSTSAWSNANCAHSQSWQCQGSTSTATKLPTGPSQVLPQTANPSGAIVTPLGSVPADHHNVMLVPPQPPAQQIPDPPKTKPVVAPPMVLPPQRVPVLVIAPTQGPGQQGVHHELVVHEPHRPRPITSGHHTGSQRYSLEFIEPGIQNHKVEVYRSRDAQELLYKDVIPMDAGGFHLTVIGIRNPDYIH